jgi:hypothetical protein
MVNAITSIDGVTAVNAGVNNGGAVGAKKKIVTEYIYIQTPPEECYNRKIGRARAEEDGVVPKYFHELHDKHEDWLTGGYLEGVGTTGIINVPYSTRTQSAQSTTSSQNIYAIGVARVHIIRGHETREQVLEQIVNILGPNQLIKKIRWHG